MNKNTEPEYLTIGTIVSSWGLQGHVKVTVETDFPERFSISSRIYVDSQAMIIDEATLKKGQAVIKLHGVNTRAEADELIGCVVEVHHSQLFSLEEGKYYYFQLIDLEVHTTSGDVLGKITEILGMASADIYVIKGESNEILFPATDEFIKSIDLERGIMIIEPIGGLLELNEKKKGK